MLLRYENQTLPRYPLVLPLPFCFWLVRGTDVSKSSELEYSGSCLLLASIFDPFPLPRFISPALSLVCVLISVAFSPTYDTVHSRPFSSQSIPSYSFHMSSCYPDLQVLLMSRLVLVLLRVGTFFGPCCPTCFVSLHLVSMDISKPHRIPDHLLQAGIRPLNLYHPCQTISAWSLVPSNFSSFASSLVCQISEQHSFLVRSL